MSRAGNRPIQYSDQIKVLLNSHNLTMQSDKGELSIVIPELLSLKIDSGFITVSRSDNSPLARSLHGTFARIIKKDIEALTTGLKRVLEFKGTGYRVRVEGSKAIFNMGYSHEISIEIPKGIAVEVVKNTITISGIDARIIGNLAAKFRETRPPEVYKGKGVKYKEEIIKRKDGKAASGAKG